MSAVKLPDGSVSRDVEIIMEQQVRFYEQLYTEDTAVEFQSPPNKTKINNEHQLQLEQMATKEELGLALKQMKRNKSPGLDGLTAEFYKMFWCKIGDTVYQAFSYNSYNSYNKGLLYMSARRGIITLIPKKGETPYMSEIGGQYVFSMLTIKFCPRPLQQELRVFLMT